MDMLTLSHVSKAFGSHKIIDNLSFKVPEHTIYGFIGQNGAGKTTTMKMILGLYSRDAGEILVNGEKVTFGQNKTNRYIGYLPDVPEFYSYMTPAEYLNLCGEITGIDANTRKKEIPEFLEMVGLEKANKRIHGFSRGMKQRLGIAQAMLNHPKLLICDEPTSALDPLGRKEIMDIILSVKEHTTVIFSTHILSDVERVCDEIGVLHQGKLSIHGTMDEVRNLHPGDGFHIEFVNQVDAGEFMSLYPDGIQESALVVNYKNRKEDEMLKVLKILTDHNLPIKKAEMNEPTLETLFMEAIAK